MIIHPDNKYTGNIGEHTALSLKINRLLIQNVNFGKNHKRVPAWQSSYSDYTCYHGIKSIKNHCGTSTAWSPQTSTRLYFNFIHSGLHPAGALFRIHLAAGLTAKSGRSVDVIHTGCRL